MLILFADAHMVVIIIILTYQSNELTRGVNVIEALTDSKIEELVNGIEDKSDLSHLNQHTRTALKLLTIQQ